MTFETLLRVERLEDRCSACGVFIPPDSGQFTSDGRLVCGFACELEIDWTDEEVCRA